jgi:hypothetical protein
VAHEGAGVSEPGVDFEMVWSTYVVPLAGSTVTGRYGLENQIASVDDRGVTRVSRNGLTSRIPIEPFRWAIERVLSGATIERNEINEEFPHRYSSGVMLVLEQIEIFEPIGPPSAVRLRR